MSGKTFSKIIKTITYKIYPDGSKCWHLNGKPHRDNDQPAVINPDGFKYWYLNGKFIRYEEA